jgi:hypothetical protein
MLDRVAAFLGKDSDGWPLAAQTIFGGQERPLPEDARSALIERNRHCLVEMAERFPDPCVRWAEKYL